MAKPTTRKSTRNDPSMRATGAPIFLRRARSLLSMEQPTKAPAMTCMAVLVPWGTQANPKEMFSAATPTKAPTIYAAGTLSFLNSSPHATPAASVATIISMCSTWPAPHARTSIVWAIVERLA